MIDNNTKVLLIYTGGTIGMVENPETGALEPFNFSHLNSNVPEINQLNFKVDTYLYDPPIDSSDVSPEKWNELVRIIETNYDTYDGFVVLHGTDTMAYSASALSIMLENLTKPVIFTGSQLPIGKFRTDGKENLLTALEIAADKDDNGRPTVPELCVYMQNLLMRGNRTSKINAENFTAFISPNYPYLAEAGVDIRYDKQNILKPDFDKPVIFNYGLDSNVATLRLFPGVTADVVRAILELPSLKGVVLETYGSGNSMTSSWFLDLLRKAVNRGVVIVNVTQCMYGTVDMHRYENGQGLEKIGVVSGYDLTVEAAITKMMVLFGEGKTSAEVTKLMAQSLAGELSNR